MEKEAFADNAEFQGAGVPNEERTAAGNEAAASAAADGEGKETAVEKDQPQNGADPEEAKTDGAGAEPSAGEAKAGAAVPDPLDQPIEDWAKVDLGLGDAPVDKTVIEAFGKTCIDMKLTPRQAAELAQFQMRAVQEAAARMSRETMDNLRKEWGADADQNQQRVQALVKKVDQALGGSRFTDALNSSGAVCYSEVVNGLLAISRMLGEDRLGKTQAGASPQKPETAYEGLREVFQAERNR